MYEKELSPNAAKLVELTTREQYGQRVLDESVDLGAVLREHPELLPALQEYQKWRDEMNKHEEESDAPLPIAHELQRVIKVLRSK